MQVLLRELHEDKTFSYRCNFLTSRIRSYLPILILFFAFPLTGQNEDSLYARRELHEERMGKVFVGLDVSTSLDLCRVVQSNPMIQFRPGLGASFGCCLRRHYSEQVSAEAGFYLKLYRIAYYYQSPDGNYGDADVLGVIQLPLRLNLKKEIRTDTYLGFTGGCLLTHAPSYNVGDTLSYMNGLGNASSRVLTSKSISQKMGPAVQPVWQLGLNMEFVRRHNFSIEAYLNYFVGPDNLYLEHVFYQAGFGEVQQARAMITGSYMAAGIRIHWPAGAIRRLLDREVIVL